MPATKKRAAASNVQSPLETYLREINETALLTAQDERELAVRIGEGDLAVWKKKLARVGDPWLRMVRDDPSESPQADAPSNSPQRSDNLPGPGVSDE